MLNCKIRLLDDYPGIARIGETITFVNGKAHYSNGLVDVCAYDSIDNFKQQNTDAKFEVIEMDGKPVKIEDHPAFKNDGQEKLFPIYYALGGKDNPLKDKEEFVWVDDTYRVNLGHVEYKTAGGWHDMASQLYLEQMINDPSKIIRRPQFSDDEKALMRLYVKAGYPIFKPEAFQPNINAWEKSEIRGRALPDGILMQITDRFDAAAYLESEEPK